MLISYAQNFEDVLLWRALGSVANGVYIDVGAQDPLIDSVSLAFYQRGWRGIHVEPSAHFCARLRSARPDEVVIEAAAGTAPGYTDYFEIAGSGFSTCDPEVAAAHQAAGRIVRRTKIGVTTLAEIFGQCGDRAIHWLKIDVEGFEAQTLRGWASSPARPWIVVVESVHPLTRQTSAGAWEMELLRRGYELVRFDGLNGYYVATGHAELVNALSTGPNVFDDFALNGTASSPYCSLLNQRLASLDDEKQRLAEYAHNLHRSHNSDREAWALEQAETARYVASLKEWGAGAEAYAKSLEVERRRLLQLIGLQPASTVPSTPAADLQNRQTDPPATHPLVDLSKPHE